MFFTVSKKTLDSIIATKVKNRFPIDDVLHELKRVQDETVEAIEEFKRTGNSAAFEDELADIVIFTMTAAKFAKVNLTAAVSTKVRKNAKRKWT